MTRHIGHDVSRLIIAPSTPFAHQTVLDALEDKPADVLRWPDIYAPFRGLKEGPPALQEALWYAIEFCVSLHKLTEVTIIGTDEDVTIDWLKGWFKSHLPDIERTLTAYPKSSAEDLRRYAASHDACVVACVDYREPFAQARTEICGIYDDMVTIPGAAKWLIEAGPLQTDLFHWLSYRKFTSFRVLQHEDCGAYGPELREDELEERLEHYLTMREFMQIAKAHEVAVDKCGFIHMSGHVTWV